MSLNLNKVVIAGRLTRDPEIKVTQTGIAVCSFSVAVNKRVTKDNNPETNFFDVTAWRERAEFVGKYFRKGSAICVCGQLDVNKWEDRNGNKRQNVQIVADDCLFVESKSALEEQSPQDIAPTQTSVYGTHNTAYNSYTPPAQTDQNFEQIDVDDDLPF